MRGNAFARDGRFEQALTVYLNAKTAAELQKISAERAAQIAFDIGVCRYRLNQIEEAVIAFETAIRLHPRYEKALYALGMAEATRRNWPQAESAFIAAVAIDKSDAEAWFDLAYVYLAKNDFGRAKTAFEMAIKYNSVDTAISHNNVGVILAARGEVRKAISEFESAVRLSHGKLTEAISNLEICKRVGDKAIDSITSKNFKYEISDLRLNLIERS